MANNMVDYIATINSAIRTALGLVVVGAIGIGGWFGYSTYYAKDIAIRDSEQQLQAARNELGQKEALLVAQQRDLNAKDQQIADKEQTITDQKTRIDSLGEEIERKDEEIDRLATSNRLLKMQRRVALLDVLGQETDANGMVHTLVEFVEVNDEGQPLAATRQFRLKGDMVHIDCWIVKFDDKYVESADLDRATSICLFRRIYGEFREPSQGFTLDEVGQSPQVYARGGRMSDFEKKIWGDFWTFANDREKAVSLGIRAAHGQGVHMKVEPGKTYPLELRASGGISILPPEQAPRRLSNPAAAVPSQLRDRLRT